MIKKFLRKGYILIGLVIFAIILKKINFEQLQANFFKIEFPLFALGALFYISSLFFQAFRWKIILAAQNIHYSFKDAFLIYGSAVFLGSITPGKIGDFSKIAHLKKDNFSFSKAFLGTFLDKIADLTFAVIFILVSLLLLPAIPDLPFNYLAAIKWVVLIISIFFLTIFLLYKKSEAIKLFFIENLQDLKKFRPQLVLKIAFFTILTWLMFFLFTYLTAASIGIARPVGLFYFSFAAALVIISGLLPISVLNIGTREALLLFLLLPFGIAPEIIILFSLLLMIGSVFFALIGFFCWLKKPII